MIAPGNALKFAAVAVVIIAIPGPSVLFTISRALTHGRRTALLNVIGNSVGLGAQVVAIALGLGVAVERSAEMFTIVKLAGVAYLFYLGGHAILRRRSLAQAVAGGVPALTPLQAIRDGAIVGVTNPKTLAVLVAVLPQFTSPAQGRLPAQMVLVGMLFPLIALALDSVWALAAGTLSRWLSHSPRRLAAVGGAGGMAIIAVGVSLAATGRKD